MEEEIFGHNMVDLTNIFTETTPNISQHGKPKRKVPPPSSQV